MTSPSVGPVTPRRQPRSWSTNELCTIRQPAAYLPARVSRPWMVSANNHRVRPSGSRTVAAWSPPDQVQSFLASNIRW
jgi:hypothetical protein